MLIAGLLCTDLKMTEIYFIYSLYGFNMIKNKDTDSNIFISFV